MCERGVDKKGGREGERTYPFTSCPGESCTHTSACAERPLPGVRGVLPVLVVVVQRRARLSGCHL